MTYAVETSRGSATERWNWLVSPVLFIFLIACVFDPADLLVGGKVFVFITLWIATVLSVPLSQRKASLAPGLAAYVATFIAIPLISIILYYAFDGHQPYEGFAMLKGYLLISLAIVLTVNRIDLMPQLSAFLTALALVVIAVFVVLLVDPTQYDWLKSATDDGGLLILDKRPYGNDIKLLQIYFVTSPMLVMPIAYYFDRAMTVAGGWRKLFYLTVTVINIAGMILAGTRNNILVALLIPFLLWPVYTRKPAFYFVCSFMALAFASLLFADYLTAFLDPAEASNNIKLETIQDYFNILSDPVTLLFGQGLGAYYHWTAKQFSYVTELTYLEMLRNFGLIGATVLMSLLLFPVGAAVSKGNRKDISLAIAWVLYLIMCASNPNLFSSMGILILSILLANIFLNRDREARAAMRGAS